MNFDLIAGLVLGALATAGKPKALQLLEDLKAKSLPDYKAVLYALNAAAQHLKVVVTGTATSLDDQALAAVEDILATSASNNGLSL